MRSGLPTSCFDSSVLANDSSLNEAAVEKSPHDASENIGSLISRMAASRANQAAIVMSARRSAIGAPGRMSISFADLEAYSNQVANGLANFGVQRGLRTLLMVRPGVDFVATAFALFKIGAVPVLIDPGMGVGRMLDCIRQVDVEAFIGIPRAQALRLIKPAAFPSVRHVVTVGSRWRWGGTTLTELSRSESSRFDPAQTSTSDVAAILFTSGSTGPAKGVVYEHGMFAAQVRMIQAFYGIEPGEVDLPAFPLFALFSIGMGMTAVIPDMDPSRPARTPPERMVSAILEHGVTSSFGSPAIWRRVGPYCVERGIRLPTIRRILIAGASVPAATIQQLLSVIPETADVHTPYGATEALPVASIGGRELLAGLADRTLDGAGTCVGRLLPGTELRILRVTNEPLASMRSEDEVRPGEAGELAVSGPVVTREYFRLPDATRAAKIVAGDRIWHRMGDIGCWDEQGRVWFHGRKSHRVWTLAGPMDTDRCEPVFNAHPDVVRSALVGVGTKGAQTPVMVIEPRHGAFPRRLRDRERFLDELLARARHCDTTRVISRFLFHPSLPVDVRHNAKINREALAEWAAKQLP